MDESFNMDKGTLPEQPSLIVHYFCQLLALLYKNILLFRRNFITTTIHLITPAIFVLIFGIIRTSNNSIEPNPTPEPYATLSSGESSLLKCTVFDNDSGKYGLGAPIPGAECLTFVYSPSTGWAAQVMEQVAKRNGLIEKKASDLSTGVPFAHESVGIDILGFDTKSQMNTYLRNTPGYGRVYAGVEFRLDLINNYVPPTNPEDFEYVHLPHPPTIAYDLLYNETIARKSYTKNIEGLEKETTSDTYVLRLQRAINEAILSLHSGKDDSEIEVALKDFPSNKGLKTEAGSSNFDIDQFGGMFYFAGIMFSFVIALRHIVQEKESKILDGLRMTGLMESCYWLSWLIYFGIIMLGSTLLMLLVGVQMEIPMFLHTDFTILFTSFYFYFLAMLSFAMFVSTLVPTSFSALVVGFFLATAGLVIQLFISFGVLHYSLWYNTYIVSPSSTALINLYPPFTFAKLENNFFAYTREVKAEDGSKTHGTYGSSELDGGAYEYVQVSGDWSGPYDFSKYNATTSCKTEYDDACYVHHASVDYNLPEFERRAIECSWDWGYVQTKEQCDAFGALFEPNNYVTSYDGFESTGNCRCTFTVPPDRTNYSNLPLLVIFYSFCAWYFGNVITYGHGRPEHPLFIFFPWYWVPSLVKKPACFKGSSVGCDNSTNDVDVANEMDEVNSMMNSNTVPIDKVILHAIFKQFRSNCKMNGFTAVDGVSLQLHQNQVFALLGHNGAGKTTTINMMVGLTKITGGDCIINGLSVVDNLMTVRRFLGICPQHDILWNQLSSVEHMRFYGIFQGMSLQQIRKETDELLSQVRLDSVKHLRAGSYSGGMKRRLSVTLAALGNKKIIFLDEPTTGMDPQNRRHVWEMINNLKKNRIVVLTTHAMEEADALGDRIGIMSHGQLIALGSSLHLKNKFGGVYQIKVTPSQAEHSRRTIIQEVSRLVPGVTLSNSSSEDDKATGPLVFDVPPALHDSLPRAIEYLENDQMGMIKNWGLSQTTLEDVFIRLTKANDDIETPNALVEPEVVNDRTKGDKEERLFGSEIAKKEPNVEIVDIVDGNDGHYFLHPENKQVTNMKQIRGLFRKSLVLQKRQKFTTCFQILLPLILIAIAFFLKKQLAGILLPSDVVEQCSIAMNTVAKCFGTAPPSLCDKYNTEDTVLIWKTLENYYVDHKSDFEEVYAARELAPEGHFTSTNPFLVVVEQLGLGCENVDTSKIQFSDYEPPAEWFFGSLQYLFQYTGGHTSRYDDGKDFSMISTISDNDNNLQSPKKLVVAMEPKEGVDRSVLEQNVGYYCPTTLEEDVRSPAFYSEHYYDFNSCWKDSSFALEVIDDADVEDSQHYFFGVRGSTQPREVFDGVESIILGNRTQFLEAQSRVRNQQNTIGGLFSSMKMDLTYTEFNYTSRYIDENFGETVKCRDGKKLFDLEVATKFCPLSHYKWYNDLSVEEKKQPTSKLIDKHVFNGQSKLANGFGNLQLGEGPDELKMIEILQEELPSIALLFHNVDPTNGKLSYTVQRYRRAQELNPNTQIPVQFGEVATTIGASGIPRWSYGDEAMDDDNRLLNGLTAAMMNEISKKGLADASPFGQHKNLRLGTSIRRLPTAESGGSFSDLEFLAIIFALLVSLATSFVFPVLVFHIVYEKEHKLRSLMMMMGLRLKVYWFVQYLFDTTLVGMLCTVTFVAGSIMGLPMFENGKAGLMFFTMFLWIPVMVALSIFTSSFFQRSRTSNILLYIMVIAANVVSIVISFTGESLSTPMPTAMRIFPPFNYFRMVQILSFKVTLNAETAFSTGSEFGQLASILVLQYFVLLTLAVYLDQVLPKEFGIRRAPFFFIEDLLKLVGVDICTRTKGGFAVLDEDEDSSLDVDVLAEKKSLNSNEFQGAPVRLHGLRKVYHGHGPAKIAVKNLHLHFNSGELFGLLGPNGAGKTTVISVLTGLFGATSGESFVCDFNIATEMHRIYEKIGICPQFDITWPSLTIAEHLLFYARLKGVSAADEKRVVEAAALAVNLQDSINMKSKELSGGMRRRLSLAMSLVGDPAVVFLDEPTTGIDPETRRQIWNMIEREKGHRCVVLTTHSMEEADVLCDRIGIMTHGELKALGPNQHLKAKFSQGFVLNLSFTAENASQVGNYLNRVLPSAEVMEQFNETASYKITNGSIADLFLELLHNSKNNGVKEWGIRQTSLEEVFVQIAQQAEEEFGMA